MKTLPFLLFAPIVALIVAASANAAPAESASKAQALVRAMRSDELAVSGAKRAFASGAVKNFTNANLGCVKRTDYQDFTPKLARAVEQVLKPEELDTALAFYQSKAGVKFVEGTIRRLRTTFGEESGLPKISGVEDISPEERDAISAFASSDLGRKISGKQMTESPATLQFGRDMIEEIGRKCSK